jgi:predicted signal transduction protein with EAL and GGDEF domain
VIVMPDVDDPADIARGAQKILGCGGERLCIDGHELNTTPAWASACIPTDGTDVETLLKNADAAMYHAKESGRNNTQFFTPDMNTRALERLSLERSCGARSNAKSCGLHYQPQYEVGTGRIVGVRR